MANFRSIGPSKFMHSAVRTLFEKAGYHWEVRRTGEVGLGLWRIRLRSKKPREAKRTLVLIPGFGDTPLSWLPVLLLLRPLLPMVCDELVLMDFPGYHGFLSSESCVPSMDALLLASGDALDSLKPQVILGHSLGGWLAAHYAVDCALKRRPRAQRSRYAGPEKLVVVAPSGVFQGTTDREAFRAIFEEATQHGFGRFSKYLWVKEPAWFKWTAQEFARFFEREDTRQFLLSVREDHELTEHLAKVQSKVWVIWGDDDRLCPTAWAKEWMSRLGPERADGVLLRNTGHSPQLERPVAMAALLGQVLLGKKPHERGSRWWTPLMEDAKAGAAASLSSAT